MLPMASEKNFSSSFRVGMLVSVIRHTVMDEELFYGGYYEK
jgi:hypothetical protein